MFHFIFGPKEYTFTLQEFHMFSDVGSIDASPLASELTLSQQTLYIYHAPSKARNANVIYISH